MRRKFSLFLLAGLLLSPWACADVGPPTAPDVTLTASANRAPAPSVTVMTRNLYLGADIDALLAPGADPSVVLPVALAQLQHNDYPARAQHLAQEIVAHQPAVVGLQEVSHYVFYTAGGTQTVDFVDILQFYLGMAGAQYDVAVRQDNVALTFPLGGAGGFNSVSYMDGDAILVRHDVPWSDPAAGHYPTQVMLNVAGYQFANLRGWNAVTVGADGFTFRFVNTHLEIQPFRPVQEQQARELVALLQDETLPLVLVGDFNSAANPSAPAESKTDSYHILRNAGFADIELREPHSNTLVTCCNAADLSNTVATYDQRLDLVLARFGNAGYGGQSSIELTGTPFIDPSGYTLWPSDHAGVVATLQPAPGLAMR